MFNGYHNPKDARKAGDYGMPTSFSFRKGLIFFILFLIISSILTTTRAQDFTETGAGGPGHYHK